jgi:predicted ATPase
MTAPILKSIRFENYRCLRKVTIHFEPLTVLVGGNATGKSSVLRGICEPFTCSSLDSWMRRRSDITIQHVVADGRKWSSLLRFDGTREFPGPPPFGSQLLQLDLRQLRSSNQLTSATRVDSTGSNLPNTFASLTRRQQTELVERFCAVVPMYRDVAMLPLQSGGHHTLRFQDRWSEDVWYTPDQVSDGTMLVLAYLVLMFQQPQVELVAIEEPERGLHPFLLGELVKFFRAMSRGEVGPKPVQVVLATHSAGLLDHVEPREVRLLSRDRESGEVRVESIDESTPNWRQAYDVYEHSLGGIWLSGGIGGTP